AGMTLLSPLGVKLPCAAGFGIVVQVVGRQPMLRIEPVVDFVGILPVVEKLSAGPGDISKWDDSGDAVYHDGMGLSVCSGRWELVEQRAHGGSLPPGCSRMLRP